VGDGRSGAGGREIKKRAGARRSAQRGMCVWGRASTPAPGVDAPIGAERDRVKFCGRKRHDARAARQRLHPRRARRLALAVARRPQLVVGVGAPGEDGRAAAGDGRRRRRRVARSGRHGRRPRPASQLGRQQVNRRAALRRCLTGVGAAGGVRQRGSPACERRQQRPPNSAAARAPWHRRPRRSRRPPAAPRRCGGGQSTAPEPAASSRSPSRPPPAAAAAAKRRGGTTRRRRRCATRQRAAPCVRRGAAWRGRCHGEGE